jgi:toxin ParE1/3/4
MAFKIEFSADCARDFEAIFDHLFASYVGFGESAEQALEHAALRIAAIRHAAAKLAASPMRGTLRDDVLPGVRHITIDRAIYWFDVDPAAKRIRILAIFFGGQDLVRRMLVRLLRDDTAVR